MYIQLYQLQTFHCNKSTESIHLSTPPSLSFINYDHSSWKALHYFKILSLELHINCKPLITLENKIMVTNINGFLVIRRLSQWNSETIMILALNKANQCCCIEAMV